MFWLVTSQDRFQGAGRRRTFRTRSRRRRPSRRIQDAFRGEMESANSDGATLPTKHGHAGSAAAPRTAVIREYQSDSSSKKPRRPLVFSTRTQEIAVKKHETRTASLDNSHSISAPDRLALPQRPFDQLGDPRLLRADGNEGHATSRARMKSLSGVEGRMPRSCVEFRNSTKRVLRW
jgi:hypothetical protein